MCDLLVYNCLPLVISMLNKTRKQIWTRTKLDEEARIVMLQNTYFKQSETVITRRTRMLRLRIFGLGKQTITLHAPSSAAYIGRRKFCYFTRLPLEDSEEVYASWKEMNPDISNICTITFNLFAFFDHLRFYQRRAVFV